MAQHPSVALPAASLKPVNPSQNISAGGKYGNFVTSCILKGLEDRSQANGTPFLVTWHDGAEGGKVISEMLLLRPSSFEPLSLAASLTQ